MTIHVGTYYFPGFHPDPRTNQWHGEGWTEWDVLRTARPRFDGHRQPRVSEWGAFDETDPTWAERQIDLASSHGVTAMLFDWYWYDGPFLNAPLDRAFIPARNALDLDFALMWANHDWLDVHPSTALGPVRTLLKGGVDINSFRRVAEHIVTNYFSLENYLRLDGAAYFSIYDVGTLIEGFGSLERAKQGLELLREQAELHGVGPLHLNMVLAEMPVLPGERTVSDRASIVRYLGFDSVGSYVWIHDYDPSADGFPKGSYAKAQAAAETAWVRYGREFDVPYFPNVTVGWDSSPRTVQSDVYEARGYPWLAVLDGKPDEFRESLAAARAFLPIRAADSLISINAWNEWTEGSYLLPDVERGAAYLEAVRDVFPPLPRRADQHTPTDLVARGAD